VNPVLVLYATRDGHTRHIAEHAAATLRTRGLAADVVEVGQVPAGFSVRNYAAAILAASVHMGRHERQMVEFVKTRRKELESLPTAFLSVSLSEAGVERPSSTPHVKAEGEKGVRQVLEAFFAETGWHPARVRPIAGALLYREYGFLKRMVLRMISKRSGGDTDTSRDHEYTDWEALERFVDGIAEELQGGAAPPSIHEPSSSGARAP